VRELLSGYALTLAGSGGLLDNRLDLVPDGLRFRAPRPGAVLATYPFVLWVLALGACISAFMHPHRHDATAERVALVVIVIVFGAFIGRVIASGTLVADRTGVRSRARLRTSRSAWSDIDGFAEVVAPIGASGIARRFLRVRLSSGRVRNLTGLDASRRDASDSIGRLVAALEHLRQAGPPQG